MTSLEEIEAAASRLSTEDFSRLRDWILDKDYAAWDRQIEEDAASGKLDFLIAEVEEDIREGRTRPLNEIIDHS